MKFLKTLISIHLFTLFLLACVFDRNRQLEIHLPALLEVVNKSTMPVEINSIYNSNTTLAGFLIKGGKLTSGQTFVTKINETTFDAIKQGKYFIEGSCGNVNNWTIEGNQLEEKFIENNSEWKITIIIDSCNVPVL